MFSFKKTFMKELEKGFRKKLNRIKDEIAKDPTKYGAGDILAQASYKEEEEESITESVSGKLPVGASLVQNSP